MGPHLRSLLLVAVVGLGCVGTSRAATPDDPAERIDPAAWYAEAVAMLGSARGDEHAAAALALLQRAANADCPLAQMALSISYTDGAETLALAPDPAAANHWLGRAAGNGYWFAEIALAMQLAEGAAGNRSELERSRELMLSAASRGDADIQYAVALMYEYGESPLARSDASASRWFERAAVQGHARAQMRLGAHLANGTVGESDAAQAYFWWVLAAPHDDQAREFRDRVRPTPGEASAAAIEARAADWQPQLEAPPGKGCMALP